MATIGIIAEGVTDQQVLERFLLALCQEDRPSVTFLQPPNPLEAGNWDKVFKYVASERFRGAFQNVDFVVVHLDTDVCERFVLPILQTVDGAEVADAALIEAVKLRLIEAMNQNAPDYYEQRKAQIIFSVAVHSVECWLLPLFCTRENDKKRRDNCLKLLNKNLSPLGFSIDENNKNKGYAKLMRDKKITKLKRADALGVGTFNVGFADFAAQVETLINAPTVPATPPAQ